MAAVVTYHPGGFDIAAPQQNRAELYDSATGLYTQWDDTGNQLEQRPLTPSELAGLLASDEVTTKQSNRGVLHQKTQQALAGNSTFLAISNPTAAQNAAQAKALTRQVNALIRLQLSELSDVSDT